MKTDECKTHCTSTDCPTCSEITKTSFYANIHVVSHIDRHNPARFTPVTDVHVLAGNQSNYKNKNTETCF